MIKSFDREKNVKDDNLFLYPDISNMFENVDVPDVKEVTGYIKGINGWSIFRPLISGLNVVNKKVLSGLDEANKEIVPTLDRFSNGVLKQFQNETKISP